MNGLFKTLKGLWSLVVGLKITGVELCKPWLTVHYPRQEVENRRELPRPHRARAGGRRPAPPALHHVLEVRGDLPLALHQPAHARQGRGARQAPGGCGPAARPGRGSPYSTHQAPPPDTIERVLDVYRLNYSLCSLCGLCVQSCPVDAIRFSGNVYLVGTTRDAFDIDLLARLRARSASA